KIVVTDGEIEDDGAEFIINPYDEYAVEEAIVQRDKHGGEVTVVTIGDEDSEKQLRTALAMGADKAVLINTEDDLEDGDQFTRSEEHTSELQSRFDLVCRLLLEKKKKNKKK